MASADEHEADGGTVARGEVGMVIGRQGERYVIRWGASVYSVRDARDLRGVREAKER